MWCDFHTHHPIKGRGWTEGVSVKKLPEFRLVYWCMKKDI